MTALLAIVRSNLADRQFRAGFDLASSSALNAIAGLAFWFVAARAFDESVVGVNAALISIMVFVANFAGLGMKNGLINFMPSYGSRAGSLIGRTYATTGGLSLVLAPLVALAVVARVEEMSLFNSFRGIVAFSLACLIWVIFDLQDSVLVGLGRTKLIPVANLAHALAKLALLGLFAVSAAQWGIFTASVLPLIAVTAWINTIIVRSLRARHHSTRSEPEPGLVRFAIGEHASAMLNMGLLGLVPVFVLDQLGERASAFYAMAWAIAFNLMLANSNVSTAVLAEAAQNRTQLPIQARKAFRQMILFVIPGALALVVFAPIGLRVFGASYSSEGSYLLRLLALTAIANIPVAVSIGMLRARSQVARVFAVYAVRSVLIGGLCVVLGTRYGLAGCGWAWLIGESTMAIALTAVQLRSVVFTVLPDRLIDTASRMKAKVRRWQASRRLMPLTKDLFPTAISREVISASADVAVLRLDLSLDSSRIVKVASSALASERLNRETVVLDDLAQRAELDDWRRLIAAIQGRGEYGSATWVTQSMISGVPASHVDTDSAALAAAVIAALTPLHKATARTVLADQQVLDRIVTKPIETISRWRPALAGDLVRIGTDVCASLSGRRLEVCRIHGDYAPGNVILDATTGDVAGIVDWELSVDELPPEIDLTHFVLALAAQRQRTEYGETVISLLRSDRETPEVASIRAAIDVGPNRFDVGTCATLAWIHHLAANLDKADSYRTNAIWLSQNVDRVVDSIRVDRAYAERS